MFTSQLAQTRALLGSRLALYQVHSLTDDSPLFGDGPLLSAMAALRAEGVLIGLSTSGPRQADTLRRALSVTIGGAPLFAAAQVTWNLLEPAVAAAAAEAAQAGWAVFVKEAVGNGRLAPGGDAAASGSPLGRAAAKAGATPDAVAIAAALAQPWATIVLSGAVSVRSCMPTSRPCDSTLRPISRPTSDSPSPPPRTGPPAQHGPGHDLRHRPTLLSNAEASTRSPASSHRLVRPSSAVGHQPRQAAGQDRPLVLDFGCGRQPAGCCQFVLHDRPVHRVVHVPGGVEVGHPQRPVPRRSTASGPVPSNERRRRAAMRETDGNHPPGCRWPVDRR